MQGFQTFVPAQDKNRLFAKRKLREVATLVELYTFTYPEVLRYARTIDVTWMNSRKFPDSFFEVEHSTEIYKSLMKFAELQDFRAKFYIVADNLRQAEFEDKIKASIFTPIKSRVKFLNYDAVSELHTKMSEGFLAKQKLL